MAKAEIDFNQSYIERKLQASGKDPAELLQEHVKSQEPGQDDPAHGGTFKVPQNIAEQYDDGSVLLKINVTDDVESSAAAAMTNSPEGWQEAGRRIAELPLDKQLEVIGSGLAAGVMQYQHDENQRNWGQVIGTVQGVGEVSVNLAKIADFSAALILNDHDRAHQKAHRTDHPSRALTTTHPTNQSVPQTNLTIGNLRTISSNHEICIERLWMLLKCLTHLLKRC